MPLTTPQLTLLKPHIAANTNTIPAGQPWTGAFAGMQVKDVPNNGDGNAAIAGWYNLLASPVFYAWQFSRTRGDNRRAILNTAGAGNQLDALTGSKREALLWALDDTLDTRFAAVRTTIDDLTGSQNTLKNAILDSFKKQLSNIQKLYATGTGSLAVPADGAFEGVVTGGDVESARNLA